MCFGSPTPKFRLSVLADAPPGQNHRSNSGRQASHSHEQNNQDAGAIVASGSAARDRQQLRR
jgi:hypothetical protein